MALEADQKQDGDIRKFEEIGTNPIANKAAIGEALTFHAGIGGKRKAERLVVELQDRFTDIAVSTSLSRPQAAGEAVKALTTLGYSAAAAEEAVRTALEDGSNKDTSAVVRAALQHLTTSRQGSTV